ncbi:MAG: hypothetical protein Q9212_002860 [Teloschistes hypoglaucus]
MAGTKPKTFARSHSKACKNPARNCRDRSDRDKCKPCRKAWIIDPEDDIASPPKKEDNPKPALKRVKHGRVAKKTTETAIKDGSLSKSKKPITPSLRAADIQHQYSTRNRRLINLAAPEKPSISHEKMLDQTPDSTLHAPEMTPDGTVEKQTTETPIEETMETVYVSMSHNSETAASITSAGIEDQHPPLTKILMKNETITHEKKLNSTPHSMPHSSWVTPVNCTCAGPEAAKEEKVILPYGNNLYGKSLYIKGLERGGLGRKR